MTNSTPNDYHDFHRRMKDAVAALPASTSTDPIAVSTRHTLITAFRNLGDLETAEALMSQILALDPSHAGALLGQIDNALRRGDQDAAISFCDTARSEHPENVLVRRKHAQVLQIAGRTTEALIVLEDLNRDKPGDAPACLAMANLKRKLGDLDGAEAAMAQILEHDPGHEGALLAQIDTAVQRGDHEAALILCNAARKQHADSVILKRKHAQVLQTTGKMDEALAVLEDLIRDKPDDAPACLAMANIKRRLRDLDGADAAVAQILEHDPGHEGALLAQIDTALRKGDHNTAFALCDDVLSKHPESLASRRKHAQVLQSAGKIQEALTVLESLIRKTPNDAATCLALAGVKHKLGDLDAAETLYTQVLKDNPENWPALNSLAKIAESRGDLERAIALLETGSNPASVR